MVHPSRRSHGARHHHDTVCHGTRHVGNAVADASHPHLRVHWNHAQSCAIAAQHVDVAHATHGIAVQLVAHSSMCRWRANHFHRTSSAQAGGHRHWHATFTHGAGHVTWIFWLLHVTAIEMKTGYPWLSNVGHKVCAAPIDLDLRTTTQQTRNAQTVVNSQEHCFFEPSEHTIRRLTLFSTLTHRQAFTTPTCLSQRDANFAPHRQNATCTAHPVASQEMAISKTGSLHKLLMGPRMSVSSCLQLSLSCVPKSSTDI